MFTEKELMAQIQTLGIQKNDAVLIHTSLRAIGSVENGADGVINAFCSCLTNGLFLVPTHTWASVNPDNPVFDVSTSVPCIGTLPAVAAFRKDGIRSLHPTHSIWAHGKNAAEFIAGEEKAETPAPPGFAWARLADINAKILLIGVGNDKNTFIHAIDEIADIPDRLSPEPFTVTIIDRNGTEYQHPYAGHRCSRSDDVSRQFVNFEKPLVELGALQYGKLGNAVVRIVDAQKCRDIILRIYSRTTEDLCIRIMELPEELYL